MIFHIYNQLTLYNFEHIWRVSEHAFNKLQHRLVRTYNSQLNCQLNPYKLRSYFYWKRSVVQDQGVENNAEWQIHASTAENQNSCGRGGLTRKAHRPQCNSPRRERGGGHLSSPKPTVNDYIQIAFNYLEINTKNKFQAQQII